MADPDINIDNFDVGMTESYSQTISDSDVKMFAKISGDNNPVHVDEEYAKQTRFGGRVVHGLFVASLISTIFGTKFPGPGSVYVSQNLKFLSPVYVNDTVIATVKIKFIDIERRRIYFDTECVAKGKKILDGEAEIYVP